jgi:uncharacterized protein YdhG (YjbR/CyaY superfamily)
MAKTGFESVNEYLSAQPKAVQKALEVVRSAIRKAVPGGEEGISYRIPTYKLNGRMVIYFAGFKEHYSLYPFNKRLEAAFKNKITQYEISGRGTIRFPISEPVPVKLIAAIARFRAKEVADAAKAKPASKKR